jgi:ketosteroid isomerase-like protein
MEYSTAQETVQWAARAAVQTAVHRDCFAYDGRDEVALAALMSDDLVLESGAVHIGKDAALAFWRGSWTKVSSSRHHVANTVVDLHDDGDATATSYFDTISVVDGEARLIHGTYVDRLRRDDAGTWRFVAKRHQIDSTAPHASGWHPEGVIAWRPSTPG